MVQLCLALSFSAVSPLSVSLTGRGAPPHSCCPITCTTAIHQLRLLQKMKPSSSLQPSPDCSVGHRGSSYLPQISVCLPSSSSVLFVCQPVASPAHSSCPALP